MSMRGEGRRREEGRGEEKEERGVMRWQRQPKQNEEKRPKGRRFHSSKVVPVRSTPPRILTGKGSNQRLTDIYCIKGDRMCFWIKLNYELYTYIAKLTVL